MTQPDGERTSGSRAWMLALILLLAFRLPSLAQPAGGDQFLYSYVAQQVLEGGVPYRDAFEQKPPGVFGVYAVMWGVWPHESVVAAADLAAAALVAWLLAGLGRRMFGGAVGNSAAALFLLLGDPAIQRLGGLSRRAQCETFIAVAVTAALAVAWSARGRAGRLVLAGALCGVAVWLKYNAVMYAVPVAAAAVLFGGPSDPRADRFRSLAWMAAGGAMVLAAGVLCFAAAGALPDLWAATIGYNQAYSAETYRGAGHVAEYILTMPVRRGFVDGLWFVGGLGSLGLALAVREQIRPRIVALAWVAAVVLSIAINGSRGLPQYFVQAQPALALAAAAGLAIAWRARTTSALHRHGARLLALVLVLGLWRVGIEPAPRWKPRLFGVPQAIENAAFDTRYLTGRTARTVYLARFEGPKYSPAAVERLALHVRDTTAEGSPVFVFGFASGGVYVKSGRASASRFFWSRPVVLEFGRGRPGYGSDGLLADLQRNPPAIVALQKHDWGLAEDVKDSIDFFMTTPSLRQWLEAGYVPDYEDPLFSVWRRKS